MILEPVQNAGGCIPPQEGYFQRVREICDENDVLLISDEVICSWGRIGHYFGSERYGYMPDIITTAKGLTSAAIPMGAMIASDRLAEPFNTDTGSFAHGFTFGGHPRRRRRRARQHRPDRARGPLRPRARQGGASSARCSTPSRDIPIVGDVRGAGFFQAIELVKDRETKETFNDQESEQLLRGFLSGALYHHGLICRTDDRGDPVVQLAPPLIADSEQFEEIGAVLRTVLSAASELI